MPVTGASAEYNVTTRDGLVVFYDDTVDEVFQAAVRLTATDRALAEDLVQDAYLRLVRAVGEGRVTHVSTGWIVTVLRRRYIDFLRSRGREHSRMTAAAERSRSEPYPPPDDASTELLACLTPRERSALVLRYIEDLPVAEVAVAMNSTVRAAESLLQRAKSKVRTRSQQ